MRMILQGFQRSANFRRSMSKIFVTDKYIKFMMLTKHPIVPAKFTIKWGLQPVSGVSRVVHHVIWNIKNENFFYLHGKFSEAPY